MELENLRKLAMKCKKCQLHETRKSVVFGEGDEKAEIMFIGEAPGAKEDEQGRPFVGRAGQIFNELLDSIDISREDVFVANILKCRPPGNRNPLPNEIKECTLYLQSQINIVKPKIICPMGNYATQFILKHFNIKIEDKGISRIHGRVFKATNIFGIIKIIPLYHPAVATYNPDMKKVLLNDILALKDGN